MSDYILSCGSTADLTRKQMEARDIRYVCFHFILDGQDYADDMGESISSEELYQRMTAGAETKTSQVSSAEYTRYFENLLQEERTFFILRSQAACQALTIPPAWPRRTLPLNIPGEKSTSWIRWEPPADTV